MRLAVISAVAPRDYDNAMADCAMALENVQLAAAALGLGACWANQPHWADGWCPPYGLSSSRWD